MILRPRASLLAMAGCLRASMGVIGVGVVAVPEPSTSALMGIGVLAGLVGFTRRHWKKSEDRVSLAVVQ